jgi:hypothetical protein
MTGQIHPPRAQSGEGLAFYLAKSLLDARIVHLNRCAMCGRLRVGKDLFHVAGFVGAAMCAAFGCGSHDR